MVFLVITLEKYYFNAECRMKNADLSGAAHSNYNLALFCAPIFCIFNFAFKNGVSAVFSKSYQQLTSF